MNLSLRELRIIRAALSFVLDGDDSAWESLALSDLDVARDLLDALPEFTSSDDNLVDDEDDEDDYA